jgi:hypothetical protein
MLMSYAADGPFPRNAFVADQKHPKSNPTHLNQPYPDKMARVVIVQNTASRNRVKRSMNSLERWNE